MKILPLGLLSAYIIKCGIYSPTAHDAAIVLALSLVQILVYLVEYKQIPEIQAQFEATKLQLSKEMEAVKTHATLEVQSLKSQIASANLSSIKKQEPVKFRF